MSKTLDKLVELRGEGLTWKEIIKKVKGYTANGARKAYYRYVREESKPKNNDLKVLFIDIETLPMEVYAWSLGDQHIGIDMIKKDWSILSFSAKWLGSDDIMYHDTSKEKDVRDDSKLLKILHSLIDEATVLIFQNGDRFDLPKIRARFLLNGLKPTSSVRTIDTYKIARKHFALTSNKLAYMTDKLCVKYKKQDHSEFSGIKLWTECLKGNSKAFASMKKYNSYDVLSLEELYFKLAPWDKTINFSTYSDDLEFRCNCGSSELKQKGFVYTNTAKFDRFICQSCGKEHRGSTNHLDPEKKKKLLR